MKSIIKKKKKKHDQIVLLAKSKLNSIGVSISKALIDSLIGHGEFVLINNMLKHCLKSRKNIEIKTPKVVRAKYRRIVLLSKCAMSDSKKPKFIKQQEATGLFK